MYVEFSKVKLLLKTVQTLGGFIDFQFFFCNHVCRGGVCPSVCEQDLQKVLHLK